MRSIAIPAFLGAVLLLTGCGDLLSLHPLYTDGDRAFDAKLEGRWETEDDFLLVNRAGDSYEVTLQSKQNPSEHSKYEVRLVDIKGIRFADILPMDAIGHMFVKMSVTESQLRIAFFDSKWLRQRVPHEEVSAAKNNKQAVITARTPQLRKLIEKYASEPRAYDEEIVFRRPKS